VRGGSGAKTLTPALSGKRERGSYFFAGAAAGVVQT